MDTVGKLFTVTETAEEVVRLVAASRALAVIECAAFVAVVESQVME
jgi:hypothetical protein